MRKTTRLCAFVGLTLLLLSLSGCSNPLSALATDIVSVFTSIGQGFMQMVSETSRIFSSVMAMPGLLALGISEIRYDVTYMGSEFLLSSLQAKARQAAYQISSFTYHFPVAQSWANSIANDPLGVTQLIVSYYEDIISGPWPAPGSTNALAQNLAWGCMPDDAGSGLSIGVPMVALLATNGNITVTNTNPGTLKEGFSLSAAAEESNETLSGYLTNSPYGGPTAFSPLDYLYLPFSYTLALCATNPVAWQSVCAILFSPQLFQLYAQMDAFLGNSDYTESFNYTLNGVVTVWNPAVPGQFLLRLLSIVIRASLGPAYFLPYDPNNPPEVLPAFNTLAGYLLGSVALGNYIDTLPNPPLVAQSVLSLINGTDAPPGVTTAIPSSDIPALPQYTFSQSQGIELASGLTLGAMAAAFASQVKDT